MRMKKNDLTNINNDLKHEVNSLSEKLAVKQQSLTKVHSTVKEYENEIDSLKPIIENLKAKSQDLQNRID